MDEYRAALRDGHLCVAICGSCRQQQAIPADTCFACGSDDLHIARHSGSGRVFSWVVNHFAFAAELASQTPYTVVLIALDGGGRVYGRLEGPDGQQPSVGADLPVALDAEATGKRGYPVYRPVEHSEVARSHARSPNTKA